MTLAAFREERAAQKRRAILDAARNLFGTQGLAAVSMATLAAAAGVSTATLYRHFEAKEDVFACVIDELVAAFSGEADASAATGDGLYRLAQRYTRLLSDPVVLGLLRALIANRENGAGFRERLESHGNAILLREFENEITAAFAAARRPIAAEILAQSSLELRGALEHVSLTPGLLFFEVLPADARERQVSRIVESWRQHWLTPADDKPSNGIVNRHPVTE